VTGRRRKLLDDLKERRGYCHMKEEALDRTVWRAGFGRGFGPAVRQTAKWMNDNWVTGVCFPFFIRYLSFLKNVPKGLWDPPKHPQVKMATHLQPVSG